MEPIVCLTQAKLQKDSHLYRCSK